MDIHIFWEGPFSSDNLKNLNNEDKDYGVYQVYGHHRLYGPNVLLYIGMAQYQTFCVRLKQEGWSEHIDAFNVEFYVGRLAGKNSITETEWNQRIERAEKLLIYAHQPVLNTQNTKSLPEASVLSNHIFNWDRFRNLLPEVSGARYTSKYDHIGREENVYSYGRNITE